MTGPEDTLARLRDVCDAVTPEPWPGVTDAAQEEAVFVATFDPPTVRKLLEYIEANEKVARAKFAFGLRPGHLAAKDIAEARAEFEAARRALGLGDS